MPLSCDLHVKIGPRWLTARRVWFAGRRMNHDGPMKNLFRNHPAAFLLITFALGCAASSATSSLVVAAQSQPENAIYRECFGVAFGFDNTTGADELRRGELASEPVQVPAGWHVVGGGSKDTGMLLCR